MVKPMIHSKTELRVRRQELKSLELRIARLRRKLMQAGIGRDSIEQALRPLKDEWSERKEEIGTYGRRRGRHSA